MLLAMLTVWMFGACNSEDKQTTDTTDNTTVQVPVDSASLDNNDIGPEPDWYSYGYVEGDVPEPTPEATKSTTKKKADTKTTPAKLRVSANPVIYTVSQTDRPPLFSADCLTAKNPQRCSNTALADWAKTSIKYPEADLADGSDGLEYVTFVINKKGEVTSINRVDTKKEACAGCSKAVIAAILDMPDWQPAMLGGQPVNVVVTLPVRFRTL